MPVTTTRPEPTTSTPHVKFQQPRRKSKPAKSLSTSASQPFMWAKGIRKTYHKGKTEVPVLRGVDLEVHEGEFLAIIGQSGSGKSTLLHLLGTLDSPDAGEVWFDLPPLEDAKPEPTDSKKLLASWPWILASIGVGLFWLASKFLLLCSFLYDLAVDGVFLTVLSYLEHLPGKGLVAKIRSWISGAPPEGPLRIDNLPANLRDLLRNRHLGMIFQFYHLLPELTLLENVLSPVMIRYGVLDYWVRRPIHIAEAKRLIELVGLSHRLHHKPRELSGGEMQRAAIARALINRPKILLADEPTGNLDPSTGKEILEILRTLKERENLTIVMVTHDMSIADDADRMVVLENGRLVGE